MTDKKKMMVRGSYVLDVLLWALLTFSAGWGWFLALIVVESVMWLVRLAWLSPMMLKFILRRLLHMLPIIIAVVAIGFGLIQLAPGDIFSQMLLNPDIRPEDVETMRKAFGLDQPWYVQFFKYLWNVLHGDFGFSQNFKAPVFVLVNQRAANTLILSFATILIAWGFSIPAGIYAATRQYKVGDQVVSVFAFFGLSIPNYFLAFLLIFMVSSTGNWLPVGGMYSVHISSMSWFGRSWDLIKHMFIPVFVIATSATAGLTRIMRANMLEILGQQYITTARAKGIKESKVVWKHALRNAINPMITIFGFQFGAILGGAALTEQVTAWPGLGKLILRAILTQDLYLVVGSLIYGVGLLVIGNLIADILLAIVDPRVRIG
ncbi:MAG: ABC transporter permease [Spirochaetales bacterium]|nr:ABC transporter permease [Spirochaetales bacterium]